MPADQIRNRTVGCKMSDSEYERLSAVVESEGMTLRPKLSRGLFGVHFEGMAERVGLNPSEEA